MALRYIATVGGGAQQAEGSFAASLGGWKFLGAESVNNHWTRMAWNNSSLIGTFRQNNDGPGWTGNRTTTTPDLYRPIPFKAVSGTSLPHRSTAWRMLIHLLLPLL